MSEDLKSAVKEKYSEIARKNADGCCGEGDYTDIMAESYDALEGYNPDADLKLGCGIPIEYAMLRSGQQVLDLGSGAGNDLFVARSIVGERGHLTGIDFSPEMNEKAERNRRKMGYENMEFHTGEIENMPFQENTFNVVLSNCVLNLIPDKKGAFSEIFRVLKKGGHFAISDIVTDAPMDEKIRKSAELYAGCVSGAIHKEEYLDLIRKAGFKNVAIKQSRLIDIPQKWLEEQVGEVVSADAARILSVTVTGFK